MESGLRLIGKTLSRTSYIGTKNLGYIMKFFRDKIRLKITILIALMLCIGIFFLVQHQNKAKSQALPKLTQSQWNELGRYTSSLMKGETSSRVHSLPKAPTPIYMTFRRQGLNLFEIAMEADNIANNLEKSVGFARKNMTNEDFESIDTIVIDIAHSHRQISFQEANHALSNIHRGIRGLEVRYKGEIKSYPPSKFISTNRSLNKALDKVIESLNIPKQDFESSKVEIYYFEAEQGVIEIPNGRVVPMFRGNQVVKQEDVTAGFVAQLAGLHTGWLKNNLSPNGAMAYKYWPSRGAFSKSNNMIRQWMATVCLTRTSKFHNDQELLGKAAQNIRYNLKTFYKEEQGLGLIEFRGKVKLGALALAALAIMEHPDRDKFRSYEKALTKTIFHLWHEDGSFTTFYKSPKPVAKDSNANFYPGEALLMLATLYAETRDENLLNKITKSIEYYQKWHHKKRNPAFIPWHTQAYYKIWTITKGDFLRDHIFTMNDWLLSHQQWSTNPRYPDIQGRFYSPNQPFGPPHSSSTGVYLEGLIDAYSLAKAMGDVNRQKNYREAIVKGLRSVAQLTFMDDIDLFYISRRDLARGGVRQTVYNNEIRVDNIQHNLMGILKILVAFEAKDFLL